MQYFKGDATELKFYESGKTLMDEVSLAKDEFFDDAYLCQVFGDLIFDMGISPLSNAIPKAIFRESYPELVDSFVLVGTFESYLEVFQKIFGESVNVTFTVPGPGQLEIDIIAEGIELSEFVARYIQNNQYFFDEIIDDESDNIVFQTIKGFQSQYELERMLFEMVPAGIATTISLTLGE